MDHPFIEFKDIQFVAWILNNIGYRVFFNNQYEAAFTDEFKHNLKKAIVALYDRDSRLELFPENFWIIEKELFTKYKRLKNDEVTSQIPHSLLINMPHTIPFTLRAKVFQHLVAEQKD